MTVADPSTQPSLEPVTVIGAGIVGLSTAIALQRRGRAVRVIDRGPPGHGASFGHAGGIAVTWVSPQGLPGVVRHLPGWLLDPLGPVAVRWPYLPRLLPWLLRLQAYSRRDQVKRIGDVLAGLMKHAWPAWDRLLTELDMHSHVHHGGALSVYRDRSQLESDNAVWDMRRERGFAVSLVEGAELRRREPALSSNYSIGVVEPEAMWCDAPMSVVEAMMERIEEAGDQMISAEVTDMVMTANRVAAIRTSAGTIDVGPLVIAAGAWSHRLASRLGHHLPLESERGYHIDIPAPVVRPKQILSLAPHKMVVTPLRRGIRLSGTAEFAGVDSPPVYRRARALIEHARAALPQLDPSNFSEWAGDRPILPDSLPVISRDPAYENVYHAFGHSHIGFTLGPVTGEFIADLVIGAEPVIDAFPLRIERFRRGASVRRA